MELSRPLGFNNTKINITVRSSATPEKLVKVHVFNSLALPARLASKLK
jgi:hypothetical protein